MWRELIPLFKSAVKDIRGEWYKEVGDSLTHTQLYLMSKLREHGPMKASKLADLLNITNSTLTAIVDKLCERGLVIRERSETDRRAVLIRNAEEGDTLAKSLRDYEIRAFKKFMDRLSEEDLINFKIILTKLNRTD